MANEAFARVKIDQLRKNADRALADGYGVRIGHPLDGDGKAGDVLHGCRGGALTERATKRVSINLGAGERQKARYAYA